MVKRLCAILAVLAAASALWGEVSAEAYLFRLDTGQTISAKAPDKALPMASTTKLMTALVASEKEWQSVTVSAGDMRGLYPCMDLEPGTALSRRDALSAML
ncbi:MAG: hypothetical protein IJT95_01375, partial [Abditibacteriota bacterium]|nr:hypothetical protein [Abditibacteriota bacterium]